MPSFYAMLAASALTSIIGGLLGTSIGMGGFLLSSLVWVVTFYLLKKWLTDLRP